MVIVVLFKTIDGKRCDDVGVFLNYRNARKYAEQDAKHLYGGFAEELKWTRSADYPKSWEAMVGITGVRYVAQTWDVRDG